MRTIGGDGIMLVPQTAAHASELFALLSAEGVHDYIDRPPPASVEHLRERLLRLESRRSPDGDAQWLNWVVQTPDETIVGYVQATVHPSAVAEIAFVLGKAFWGRGHAYAATSAMLDELRSHYGVREVRATVDPRNTRSLQLVKRLGLQLALRDAGGNLVFTGLL